MDYKVSGENLTSIADAIRTKGGTSAALSFPSGFVDAIGNISTGGSTLITKNIVANGTYNASSDNADGYSSVTVAVPSKLVTGTFTGTTTGAAMDVSVSYSGSGYPVAGVIYPSSGGNTGDIASLAQQYAVIMYSFCKSDMSSSPTFSGDTSENKAVVTSLYKYSNSDPTSSTAGRLLTQRFYYDSNATATATDCVKMRGATSMSVYISNTSYGFKEGIEYTYQLIYSS